MINSQWIVNPSVDMAGILEQFGRFLAADYRVLFESLEIPSVFESMLTPTGRRFVIIGCDDNPALLARSIFLCTQLSGAERIDVISSNLDDVFIAQNVLTGYADDIKYEVHTTFFEGMNLTEQWQEAMDKATDIVVYGDDHTLQTYRDYESPNRKVWEYANRFSIGVVRAENINHFAASEICFDFVSLYGHGRLAPKFYFIIGDITQKILDTFGECMYALFRGAIEEYRDKLPLTKKSDLTQIYINSRYATYYVRVSNLSDKDIFSQLYGDIRLVQADSFEDVLEFVQANRERISTIAIDYEDNDDEIFEELCDTMVPRICDIGEMQYPDFFEQYDLIDDFTIYINNEEKE